MNTIEYNQIINKFKNNLTTHERMFLRKNEIEVIIFLEKNNLEPNLDSLKKYILNKKSKLDNYASAFNYRNEKFVLTTKLLKYIETLDKIENKLVYFHWETTIIFVRFFLEKNKIQNTNELDILFDVEQFKLFHKLCSLIDNSYYILNKTKKQKVNEIQEIQNQLIIKYGNEQIEPKKLIQMFEKSRPVIL